jgi:hypothetical protein
VFTTKTGRPIRHSLSYKRVFRPAVRAALPHPADYKSKRGLRWHDLRHTCASLSLAVAPNLYIVMNRLGHDDIKTTINTYGHLLPSVDAALVDGLAALFEADNVVAPPRRARRRGGVAALSQDARRVGGRPLRARTSARVRRDRRGGAHRRFLVRHTPSRQGCRVYQLSPFLR